jgi:hypothetical protein
VSYAIAGYLATAVVLGGYLAWIVVRSREVAAQLLAVQDGHVSGERVGGDGPRSDVPLGREGLAP